MKIYVDIDNTICKTDGMNYSEATPISSNIKKINQLYDCLLYTSPSPRDGLLSRMPSSA